MAYIYRIVNDINGKDYIGKTFLTIEERFKQHCKDSKRRQCENRPLYKAMNKYGIEHFYIELVEECSDKVACEREIYWIEQYGSFKKGYNATMGGDGIHYIDYDMIEYNYSIYQNTVKVAEVMNISPDTVRTVLKQRHIAIKSSQDIAREQSGTAVMCLDKKTNEVIKTFPSIAEAARWLINNNLTGCKFTTIRTHISEAMRGKRKSAAGFLWK